MDKLNSIEKANYIQEEYKEFLKSSFKFSNKDYQNSFESQLDRESLFHGPYLSLVMPFAKGKCLDDLIEDGIICEEFRKFKSLNFERPLYYHQEKSIERIGKGRNVVITTGTGSGKTECFLYPILNDIAKDISYGNKDQGIRALFLYPMNALVNDQMDRIREILKDYPDITYANFTGDTPEKESSTSRTIREGDREIIIPENELISRDKIRENPPHILFTNYSMLEYLLIRPTDEKIFNPNYLDNWKFVVLDEAHTYSGAKAIEMALLLRRVTGFSNRSQQFILTSATLGEEGKSEKEIIDFASRLTSSDYSVDDIIFSKRVRLDVQPEYAISEDDIALLTVDKNKTKVVAEKYISIIGENNKEVLYDLLYKDNNVHRIYHFLKNGNRLFSHLKKELNENISEKALIQLIDLINYCEKGSTSLFDLKYHSFVKALNGIYMCFGDKHTLTLTKTNFVDEEKAFEIGNCRFCSSSFIVGKIVHNLNNNLNYLMQNDEVDIYENYGDNDNYQLDYFLIEKPEEDPEKQADETELEEFELCTKCGEIHHSVDPNVNKCKCNAKRIQIFKVNESSGSNRSNNNISECPCCGRTSKGGIVRTLNLGKDEGTSLISQILYRSMEKETVNAPAVKTINLLERKSSPAVSKVPIKQYLAFSDSRQQASFFAIFLAHNHSRMLQKRLLYEVVKNHNFSNGLSIDVIVAELEKTIREHNLFDNALGTTKNAWTAVLVELLKVDGIYGGEGLGLFNFALNTNDIMEQIPEEAVEEMFGQYHISKRDLEVLIQVCANVFRTVPAVDITKSTLTPEDRKEVLEYRRFDNYVCFQKALKSSEKDVKSFLPVNSSNSIVRYVQKVCDNCSIEDAKKILDVIFNNVLIVGNVLKKHATKEQYQIEADRFVLNNYKSTKYYRCKKCGTVTPFNIHNKCVNDMCNGELEEIDPDVVFEKNYYRKEYVNKVIERMIVREHTAQLTREKAKEYQNDFKNGNINILSCSTTFEMGIDIGGLETVFMRNVPPTPANYVQRAGRAGRSKDSTAFILTYCNLSSHDYTYLANPNAMISGLIRPPYFDVSNQKIITRHLLAASFGFFFRKYPDYFRDVDSLIFNGGLDNFRKYIKSKPDDLNQYINSKVLDNAIRNQYADFKWFDNSELNSNLMIFEKTIRDLMMEYSSARAQAQVDGEDLEAHYYKKQIDKIKEGRVIDNLSKYSVIPKYGFPVDTVNLQIYDENGYVDSRYDLSRDLKIAISEYAPDSEIVVDGNKYTSQYVTLPRGSELKKYFYFTCEKCERLNISPTKQSEQVCAYCNNKNEADSDDFFVEPEYGFKTGVNKESTTMKPAKSFSGEIGYIGNGLKDDRVINIKDQIIIETSIDDERVIRNKSNFYLCPDCGFSKIDKTNFGVPYKNIEHYNYTKRKCSNKETKLIRIGHVFKTDVAKITCKSIGLYEKNHKAKALSFLYAFLEGISKSINIDRNDISGLVIPNYNYGCYDILIYDNVPGGAGHVKRITDENNIKGALNSAFEKVNQDCCDEDTSCYNCLRNYYNQSHHSLLKRKYAKEAILNLLKVFDD